MAGRLTAFETGAAFARRGKTGKAEPLARHGQPFEPGRRLLMPRPVMPRFALPGAVLLALAVLFVIAWATQPGPTRAAVQPSQSAAVTSMTRSCPPAAPGSAAPQISMIALPGAATSAATTPGAATLRAVLAVPPASTGGKSSS